MANLKELKAQVESANALGVANLTEQGVDISSEATTYEIMLKIAEIVGGGGSQYTNINYFRSELALDDNTYTDTITLVGKDGRFHTVTGTFDRDVKLISATYDDKPINLTYSGPMLTKIGYTNVDLLNARTTDTELCTIDFYVCGTVYESVKVKPGNEFRAPITDPLDTSTFKFGGWKYPDGEYFISPCKATSSEAIIAIGESMAELLYRAFGVDDKEYPHIYIEMMQVIQKYGRYDMRICFLKDDIVQYKSSAGDPYCYKGIGLVFRDWIFHDENYSSEFIDPTWYDSPPDLIKYISEEYRDTTVFEDVEPAEVNMYTANYNYTTFDCEFHDEFLFEGIKTTATHYFFS